MDMLTVLFEDGVETDFLVGNGGGVYEDHNRLVRLGVLGADRIMDGEGSEWGRFTVLGRRPARIHPDGIELV